MNRIDVRTAARVAKLVLALGVAHALPLPAQTNTIGSKPVAENSLSRSWEFTASGSIFSIDQALNTSLNEAEIRNNMDRFMFGGDIGVSRQFSSTLAFAVGMGIGTGAGAKVVTPRIEVVWTTAINNAMNLFVPLGVGFTRHTAGSPFSTSAPRITSTIGLHTGIGFRTRLSESLALRVAGRMTYDDYEEVLYNVKSAAFNGQGNVGVSYFTRTGPPADTDQDGVPNRNDRCANTRTGATVDATGCHADADTDGVPDGIDRCASTPTGTTVDPFGCPRDTDGDGVFDAADRCAATPAGTRVDATGCQLDSDADGVAEALDRCPNTASGTVVDATGCARDTDADGVADAADRCPNSPAGSAVNETGCARDADADGVADAADLCPNTPAGLRVDATGCVLAPDSDRDNVEDSKDRCANSPIGRRVDSNGCPIVELPAVGASMPIRNIAFRTGAATLLSASYETLDQLAAGIIATPDAVFELGGHTDSRGSVASNRTLSANRAASVRAYLISRGVPAARLTAHGYGPEMPIGDNANETGRAQNRRVEIKRTS